jgi:hypothetical protein
MSKMMNFFINYFCKKKILRKFQCVLLFHTSFEVRLFFIKIKPPFCDFSYASRNVICNYFGDLGFNFNFDYTMSFFESTYQIFICDKNTNVISKFLYF